MRALTFKFIAVINNITLFLIFMIFTISEIQSGNNFILSLLVMIGYAIFSIVLAKAKIID